MERAFLVLSRSGAVPCTETLPAGSVRSVVLGVHGIGGSSQDEIQAGIAEEMRLFGAAVYRFDLPAHGENPNCQLTLQGCVDALAAVALEAKLRNPQVEDLCIFASGFGAFVTLNALHELLEMPGRIKLVLQTPSVRMDETLLNMISRSRDTLQAMGAFEMATPRPLTVTYELYQELANNTVMMGYPIPMLILHGEADSYIRMTDIQLFHRINEESKLVIIPGTSHRFLEAGAWDMVLDLTRDWFEYEQVLLSDWD